MLHQVGLECLDHRDIGAQVGYPYPASLDSYLFYRVRSVHSADPVKVRYGTITQLCGGFVNFLTLQTCTLRLP